jgi:hypothetical protein
MSLKAAIEDGLAVEDELEQEKFSGLKFFHAYVRPHTQTEMALRLVKPQHLFLSLLRL